ncbi:hypothetical protein GSY71_16455 [Pusillimonas sp. TS35]|nr:hypothetical protein [Pusillimonas sp. TS35]
MHTLLRAAFALAMALVGSVGQAHATAPATWPPSPSRMELATPYGRLHVASSEYIYESRLLLDDDEISPAIRGLLNISYAFKRANALIALVSINSGSPLCPITYRWIVLDEAGHTVSPEFGSCSENIAVSASNRKLTLRTPSSKKPDKIDVYTYDGKTVKRSTTSR